MTPAASSPLWARILFGLLIAGMAYTAAATLTPRVPETVCDAGTAHAHVCPITPAAATPVMARWFEPKPDGTFEGITGDPQLRPSDAVDAVPVVDVPADVLAGLTEAGAYPCPESGSGAAVWAPVGVTVHGWTVTAHGGEPVSGN